MPRPLTNFVNLWNTNKKKALDIIRQGGTIDDVCALLCLGRKAFYKHLAQHDEIKDEIETARRVPVQKITDVLYKLCCGYEIEEEKTIIIETAEGTTKKTEKTKKHIAPNLRAIALYLRNNSPDYRDCDELTAEIKKREIELKEQKAKDSEAWA